MGCTLTRYSLQDKRQRRALKQREVESQSTAHKLLSMLALADGQEQPTSFAKRSVVDEGSDEKEDDASVGIQQLLVLSAYSDCP